MTSSPVSPKSLCVFPPLHFARMHADTRARTITRITGMSKITVMNVWKLNQTTLLLYMLCIFYCFSILLGVVIH